MGFSSKYDLAIELIDQINATDPNTEDDDGLSYPKELLYSERMTDCLIEFDPTASELLHLAARAQHIARWTIPRSSYPDGRKGYHQWRNELKTFHAKKTAEVLSAVGYTPEEIDRVESLIQKKKMKIDPESQTIEDVICLVFLEYYFDDFAKKHEEPKVIDILKKTLNKMSEKGKTAAMKIEFSKECGALVQKAIAI